MHVCPNCEFYYQLGTQDSKRTRDELTIRHGSTLTKSTSFFSSQSRNPFLETDGGLTLSINIVTPRSSHTS